MEKESFQETMNDSFNTSFPMDQSEFIDNSDPQAPTTTLRIHNQLQTDVTNSTISPINRIETNDNYQTMKRRVSIASIVDIIKNNPNDENIKEVDIAKSEIRIHRNVGNLILILLFIVGVIAGIVNGVTLWAIKNLLMVQSMLLMSNKVGVLPLMIVTSIYAGISAFICKQGKVPAAVGSGIPEVKALLASDFHPTDYPSFLSIKIECIRISSLVFAMGSGLAVGSAGPLVHCTVCTAYALTKFIPEFGDLSDRRSTLHQIFIASAAAGLATVFNAPIGGLLFSIEVTSTYYLISNYWKSFMAAVAGAVTYSLFLEAKGAGHTYRVYESEYVKKPFLKWEYLLYFLLGLIIGVLTYVYLKLQHRWFLFAKPYLFKYPIATAASVGCFTALMIYATHGYNNQGLGNNIIVKDSFHDGILVNMECYGQSDILSLFITFIVRIILVIIGVTLRISCGVVVPMFAIGGIFGRLYGTILQSIFQNSHNFYIAGYAMVGAVAFISGTTQTISGAIIIIEMTGQLEMLLPCLIGALVASSITKYRVLSLYDQCMVNKNLESFELLLHESQKLHHASDLMNTSTTYLERFSTIDSIVNAMSENKNQNIFAIVDSNQSMILIGCINRIDMYYFLLDLFEYHNLEGYLRYRLPYDTMLEDERLVRYKRKTRNRKLFSSESILLTPYSSLIKPALSKISSIHLDHQTSLLSSDHKYSDINGNDEENQGNEKYQSEYDVHEVVTNPLQSDNNNQNSKGSGFIPISTDKINKLTKEMSLQANDFRIKTSITIQQARANVLSGLNAIIPIQSSNIDDKNDITYDVQAVENILIQQINLTKCELIPVNFFPSIVNATATIDEIYILFEMVHVSCIFITNPEKVLEGMIDKEHLIKILKQKTT